MVAQSSPACHPLMRSSLANFSPPPRDRLLAGRCSCRGFSASPLGGRAQGLLHSALDRAQRPVDRVAGRLRSTLRELHDLALQLAVLLDELRDHVVQLLNELGAAESLAARMRRGRAFRAGRAPAATRSTLTLR